MFTSANAVRFFFAAYDTLDKRRRCPRSPRWVDHGRLLHERGLTPDFVPEEFTGEALAAVWASLPASASCCRARAPAARRSWRCCASKGAEVDDIPLYETVTADPTAEALAELQPRRGRRHLHQPLERAQFPQMLLEAGSMPGPSGRRTDRLYRSVDGGAAGRIRPYGRPRAHPTRLKA